MDSRVRRQKRCVRTKRTARLRPRDSAIVESLGTLRFATSRQLARLHFGGSCGAANKRLRKLFDAGLIRAWARSLAEENVYSLDRAGLRLLNPVDRKAASAPRSLDGNLDHLLAINEFRIGLALGLETE